MIEILTIIAPVFMLMILGYALGRTSLFPEGSSHILITFVWWVGIPSLLFRAIASSELPSYSELTLVLGYYSALYLIYFSAFYIGKLIFTQSTAEAGVFGLSTCFANGAFIGIPIIDGAYGNEGVRMLLVLLSFHTLTLIPITTFIVERAKTKGNSTGLIVRTFASIRQNPILIALIIGLCWSAFHIPVPAWLDRFLAFPAQAAAPVGLFAAGMALSYVKISGDLAQATASTFLKLIMLPIGAYIITKQVLDLPDIWVGTATLMGALPTGMIAYSFADKQGVAPRRAATTVLLSTALSAFTLSFLLFVLRTIT
ncbi:AEC family transporter [Kordiimonas sp. SCSIO 12610]|uniref:AEC family transporter n=1 Tax=Kordiimonas sp. SCSIO 12610 TaxID=2829597 RepID=UPI0021094247|nr:AEC family transporter [Kordiimonas sp. SCSIO 12610]UTW55612.1 AEC family transporter [Kordiimonas sp. SCSIO 12610]